MKYVNIFKVNVRIKLRDNKKDTEARYYFILGFHSDLFGGEALLRKDDEVTYNRFQTYLQIPKYA
jgi:hypothetical protein